VSSRIGGFSIRFTVDDSPLETPLGLAGSGAGGSAEKAPADDGDGEADDINGNNGTYGEEAEGGHDDNQVEEGQGGGRGRGEAESPPETEGHTNGEAEPGAEKQRQAEEAADRGAVGETGSERAPVSAGANGFSGQAGKLIKRHPEWLQRRSGCWGVHWVACGHHPILNQRPHRGEHHHGCRRKTLPDNQAQKEGEKHRPPAPSEGVVEPRGTAKSYYLMYSNSILARYKLGKHSGNFSSWSSKPDIFRLFRLL